jgi:hypothetical protein
MRFVPYHLHHQHGVMIADYSWWHDNHYDITDWIRAHMPRGEEHLKGMTIEFDSEQDALLFMLRWQA